ncbi:MAG: ribonuclease H [Gemmatimonadota bacterium]
MPINPIAIIHLDESCLGNGREGDNPGGAGGLIEVRIRSGIERRDFSVHAPATTNNQMALAGAATVLELLSARGRRLRVLMVSDSQYLIKGIREWVPGWIRRGWTRKGGPIENLALWQRLVGATKNHEVQWTWVRGHAGHPKNEYANDLAVAAATTQDSPSGVVESGFPTWILRQREKKKRYLDYDPDIAFTVLESRMQDGDRFAVME